MVGIMLPLLSLKMATPNFILMGNMSRPVVAVLASSALAFGVSVAAKANAGDIILAQQMML